MKPKQKQPKAPAGLTGIQDALAAANLARKLAAELEDAADFLEQEPWKTPIPENREFLEEMALGRIERIQELWQHQQGARSAQHLVRTDLLEALQGGHALSKSDPAKGVRLAIALFRNTHPSLASKLKAKDVENLLKTFRKSGPPAGGG
jgi:hypothetical protein